MIGLTKTGRGPGGVALVERPDPEPGRGHVVLRVSGAGVCGTDLHIAAGEYLSVPPVTLGHEVCGTVSAVGDGVASHWLGRRVVVETFYSTCGHCPACRAGRVNLCPERQSIGTHRDGGFASAMAIPVVNLHLIPDWLDPHAATLAEPLACVCQCMLHPSEVAPGDRVLVVGPGPMGILAAQVAAVLGGEVVVLGLPADAERLAVADRIGLATSLGGPGDACFDVVIDASGSGNGITTCLRAARPGGTFVQLGITGAPVSVPLDLVLMKELRVRTGFASTPRSWDRAMGLIEGKRVDLAALVTDVVGLADWERAFTGLRNSRGLKVVIDPQR